MSTEGLLYLPGPQRFLDRLERDLRDGLSALIACPSAVVPPTPVSQVERRLAGERECTRIDPSDLPAIDSTVSPGVGAVRISHWLIETLGGGADGPSSPETLAASDRLGRRLIIIDAREQAIPVQASLLALLRAFSDASKSIPPRSRPSFLVFIDGVSPAIIGTSDVALRVHWWWGILGPLDAGVLLSRESNAGPVRTAVAVEVGRSDLDLVLRIGNEWDGRLAGLQDLVGATDPVVSGCLSSDGRDAGPAPSPDVIPGWRTGLAESWSGRTSCHVGAFGADRTREIQRRTWLGQVKEVFVVLELERRRVTSMIRSEALRSGMPTVLEGEDGGHHIEIEDLEIGQISAYLGHHPALSMPSSRREALRQLRCVRNRLAHGEPLDDAELAGLRRACRADGSQLVAL